jgi:hypothetical protein
VGNPERTSDPREGALDRVTDVRNLPAMASSARNGLQDNLRRALAVLCAVWIVILSLAAVSPELHEGLHHGASSTIPDQCAVEQLAHGALVAAPVMAPVPIVIAYPEPLTALPLEFRPDSPRYLLRPERGPPEA